jgi:urease accessory protein
LNLLALLHLCDSLFPIGAFAHSDGLESAATSMTDAAADLTGWVDVCLAETVGRLEGPVVWRAWKACADCDWDTIVALDRELIALRPSGSGRQATRAMGRRLLATWDALHPSSSVGRLIALARQRALAPTLPVAFGAACASAEIGRREAVEGYAYTRLSGAISASMRVLPVGQSEGHAILARALERVPPVVDAIAGSDAPLESFSPLMDISAMSQQYLHARLFRS